MNRADAKIVAERWAAGKNFDELMGDLVALAVDSFINYCYANGYQIECFEVDKKWAAEHGAVRPSVQMDGLTGKEDQHHG